MYLLTAPSCDGVTASLLWSHGSFLLTHPLCSFFSLLGALMTTEQGGTWGCGDPRGWRCASCGWCCPIQTSPCPCRGAPVASPGLAVVCDERATLNQKLLKKGKNESSHPDSLPRLLFQCKYLRSANTSVLGTTALVTRCPPSSSYLSVSHRAMGWRATYAGQAPRSGGSWCTRPRAGHSSAGCWRKPTRSWVCWGWQRFCEHAAERCWARIPAAPAPGIYTRYWGTLEEINIVLKASIHAWPEVQQGQGRGYLLPLPAKPVPAALPEASLK